MHPKDQVTVTTRKHKVLDFLQTFSLLMPNLTELHCLSNQQWHSSNIFIIALLWTQPLFENVNELEQERTPPTFEWLVQRKQHNLKRFNSNFFGETFNSLKHLLQENHFSLAALLPELRGKYFTNTFAIWLNSSFLMSWDFYLNITLRLCNFLILYSIFHFINYSCL